MSCRIPHFDLTFTTDIRLSPDATSRSETDLVFTMDLHESHVSVSQIYGIHFCDFDNLWCVPFVQISSITAESSSSPNVP
jgi:hypothetical protein